jgi:hypothetical protein
MMPVGTLVTPTFACELTSRRYTCELFLSRRRAAAFLNRSEKAEEKAAELGESAQMRS